MTREEAVAIAQSFAKAHPESYYAEPFQPHEWVIKAIEYAFELGQDDGVNSAQEVQAL